MPPSPPPFPLALDLSWLWTPLLLLTLGGVAVGRIPRWRMNRATIALVGAVGLILTGALTLDQAFRAIDLNTLALLLGMMILNANLRIAGFFRLAAGVIARHAGSPTQLLAWTIAVAGGLSALFLNDTVVLILTPLLLETVFALGRHPLPYLVALGVAANVGSAATIIGNPQNMLIGMASGIPFLEFAQRLAPVSLGGMLLAWGVIRWVYRRELALVLPPRPPEARGRVILYRPLLRKSLIAAALLLAGLLIGVPIPLAALTAASLLLLTRRIKPERVFVEIDWGLLLFFAGLFVVTRALESSGLGEGLLQAMRHWAQGGVPALTAAAAILSNVVSNVPAVLLFRPLIGELADPQQAWLVLAMASTLAGNLTLLGSVANLIVAEAARSRGFHLSFGGFLRGGVPVTLLTLAWGAWWLGG
ncbi:MAG: anion transporter [Magnetococcales bacterium]|nr:anion transporter [Magnetococcales bacterium]